MTGRGVMPDKGIYPLANNDRNSRKGLKPLVNLLSLRHCGLDPQSPQQQEILKQVQNDVVDY
jgi:hypothetical protein